MYEYTFSLLYYYLSKKCPCYSYYNNLILIHVRTYCRLKRHITVFQSQLDAKWLKTSILYLLPLWGRPLRPTRRCHDNMRCCELKITIVRLCRALVACLRAWRKCYLCALYSELISSCLPVFTPKWSVSCNPQPFKHSFCSLDHGLHWHCVLFIDHILNFWFLDRIWGIW